MSYFWNLLPLTAPQQKPFKDIFLVLFTIISVNIQVREPTLAAKFNVTIALTALELTWILALIDLFKKLIKIIFIQTYWLVQMLR